MKHLIASLFLAASFNVMGQDLPPVPTTDAPDLKMVGLHLDRSAEFQQLAGWTFLVGGLFAAADQINNRDSDGKFATGVLVFSATAYVGISLFGAEHKRKAARLLQHQ